MSIFQKPNKILENTVFFRIPEHNDLNHIFTMKKSVTIKIYILQKKYLKYIYILLYCRMFPIKKTPEISEKFCVKVVTINAANKVNIINIF